ncbi:MAG TPA: hypothetical protein VK600_00440 [Candidatus Saccharimonadales bacterium]|nr:hypothetical protein [Candidatus Saccharimonadales bacterium]
MSREDQPATERISLGACDCPGSPHDAEHTQALVGVPERTPAGGVEWRWDGPKDVTGDWADVWDRPDYGTLRYIGSAYAGDDTGLGQARLLQKSISAWNLLDGRSSPLFVNIPAIDKLRAAQANILVARLDRPQFQRMLAPEPETAATPPNGSGGSSESGPPAKSRSRRSTAKTPS